MSPRPHGGARQEEAFNFIRAHLKAHGIAPSLDEVAAAIGYRSKSCSQRIVDKLIRDGRLIRMPHVARGLAIPPDDHDAADCLCHQCANARYIAQLKLVQGLKVLPPVAVLLATRDNIRPLSDTTRAAFLGCDSRGPAPCTRQRAIPRSAS